MIALVGLVLIRFGLDFARSRAGALEIDRLPREIATIVGVTPPLEFAPSASFLLGLLLAFLFLAPLLWALAVRATTILRVDDRQIIWRRGVFARDITQLEIGEVVGVNVYETFMGRLLGFGTVDIETRGEDRLVAHLIANARGFAGLVLDFKHRQASR